MSNSSTPYWFPAKRYGWGWSAPTCWQGWAVIGIYVVALIVSAVSFRPRTHALEYAACVVVLTTALMIVMWMKGEKPKWRWGEKD